MIGGNGISGAGAAKSSDRFGGVVIAIAVSVIVLIPFATVGFTYRRALIIGAGAILATTLAAVLAGISCAGWRQRISLIRSPLATGVALYAAAAILGALVGLARGNPIAKIAGQFLSMGLLPLGAAALAVLPSQRVWRWFARALTVTVPTGIGIHLFLWISFDPEGFATSRPVLPNGVSVVAPALMSLLFAITLTSDKSKRWRTVAWASAILVAFYIVATGVRFLWVSTLFAVIVFLVVRGSTPGNRRQHSLKISLAVGGILVLVLAGAVAWWNVPRSNLADGEWTSGAPEALSSGQQLNIAKGRRTQVVLGPKPIVEDAGLRLRALLEGSGSGTCHLSVDWLDAAKEIVGKDRSMPVPASMGAATAAIIGIPRRGARWMQLRLSCDQESEGTWLVRDLSIEVLGGRGVSILAKQSTTVIDRGRRLIRAISNPLGSDDHSVALRMAESRHLLDRFAEASLGGKIFGHGLGAIFAFETFGRDAEGSRTSVEHPNYIHNFYVFLLFKLGLMGTAAVIAALFIWIRWPLSHLRNLHPGDPVRVFQAAVVAAWVGYEIWSLASPEILDFRMAPLWGFLIGVSGALVARNGGGNGADRC